MTYRDDLAAAHARIAALEAQLGTTGTDVADTRLLIDKTIALEAELASLRDDVGALRETHERLQTAMRAAPSSMPTLCEFNRATPPGENALSGNPAGVRCPMCLVLVGDSVEMRVAGNLRVVLWQQGEIGATNQTVRCPRCDFLGIKLG